MCPRPPQRASTRRAPAARNRPQPRPRQIFVPVQTTCRRCQVPSQKRASSELSTRDGNLENVRYFWLTNSHELFVDFIQKIQLIQNLLIKITFVNFCKWIDNIPKKVYLFLKKEKKTQLFSVTRTCRPWPQQRHLSQAYSISFEANQKQFW